MNRLIRTILLAALSSAAGAALAQPPQAQQSPADQPPADQQQHHRHGPSPKALAACKSATSGQQCSFTSAHGDQMSGTCVAREEGKPLACKPSHPPGTGGDQPGSPPPKQ
jgi:hypothetical protein